ncbi:hypothetical protein K2173_022312 [Erythroxylum novogranatense]|uniref:Pectinesterase inhibitor domain-containing protein n=1 Tax=Erythroxylum novogranatense TaxID=1862640 RepID=A0AAV8TJ54_9ROSI|nr:hypothetical protein K2173_022312 [Erythroxylum novogranatense]
MKASDFSLYSSTTLLCILLFSTSIPFIKCDDLIDQICKRTPFRDLCEASLRSSSQSSGADAKGLASIVTSLILSDATDTLDYIHGLIKQVKDPELQRPLANCAELYIPVVKYNLPQAIDAFAKGQYGFATYVLSDASKQAKACEKGFSSSTASPLSERNKVVSDLCDVAIAIIKLLQKI